MTSPTESEFQWSIRTQSRLVPAMRTNYRALPATTSPSVTEDTGQSVTYAEDSGAGYVIANGRLTEPSGTFGRAYRNTNPSSNVTRIGGRFTFDGTYGPTDDVAIVMASTNLAATNTNINAFPSTGRIAAHLYINPGYWELSKWNGTLSTPKVILTSGNFANNLITDGVHEYEAEVLIDASSSTAYAKLPDGSVHSYTDSDIASFVSNFGFHECVMGTGVSGPAVVVPGWTETWADDATYYDYPVTDPAVEFGPAGEVAYNVQNGITFVPQYIGGGGTLSTAAKIPNLSVTVPAVGERPVWLEFQPAGVFSILSTGTGSGPENHYFLWVNNATGTPFAESWATTYGAVGMNYVYTTPVKFRLAGVPAGTYDCYAYTYTPPVAGYYTTPERSGMTPPLRTWPRTTAIGRQRTLLFRVPGWPRSIPV